MVAARLEEVGGRWAIVCSGRGEGRKRGGVDGKGEGRTLGEHKHQESGGNTSVQTVGRRVATTGSTWWLRCGGRRARVDGGEG